MHVCPICNKHLHASNPIRHETCRHTVGKYVIEYELDLDTPMTNVYLDGKQSRWAKLGYISNDLLELNGFVLLDEDRIERLLVLK